MRVRARYRRDVERGGLSAGVSFKIVLSKEGDRRLSRAEGVCCR